MIRGLSFPTGPACCLLETPNVRIFGTISQSAAAKTDVSTLEACYTAYLKTLECRCVCVTV